MRKVRAYVIAIVATAMIFLMASCSTVADADLEWPKTVLGKMIPELESPVGKIATSNSTTLKMELANISQFQFDEYVEKCIDLGFVTDAEDGEDYYRAFDEDGYELELSLSTKNRMSILVEAPMKMENFAWPKSAVAQVLPTPKSNYGKITGDSDFSLTVYVGKTSRTDFNEYVDRVYDRGFTDYSRGDTYFYGTSKTDYHVSVQYQGGRVMYIHIYTFGNNTDNGNNDKVSGTGKEQESDVNSTKSDGEPTSIALTLNSDEIKGMKLQNAEAKFKEMGFGNFVYKTVDTENPSLNGTICYVEIKQLLIGHSTFSKGDKYAPSSTITFYTYLYEEKTYDIDKDLVVVQCTKDADKKTMYRITFAECDSDGNYVNYYTFGSIINPRAMGDEFNAIGSLPSWFYVGATVHVKANLVGNALSQTECIVTKA